jgi:hypothetical protein
MNDDWRVQVDFVDERHVEALFERLRAEELEHDLKKSFHNRVIVSRDGARVFLYAGDRAMAEQGRSLIERLGQQHGWELESDLRRWHPSEEEWEPAGAPLPQDRASQAAERAELMARERRQTEEREYPEFEVLVELSSRQEAQDLAERLRNEGLPCDRRWKYVAVGATDEDSAQRLADRIRPEAPTGSKVLAVGSPQAAFADLPRSVRIADELTGQVY